MTIGEAIKRSREEQGVSQEWLAEQVEVSRQAVSKWERGEAVPTPENLGRIEISLNLPAGTLAELCGREGSEDPAETVPARRVPRPLLAGLVLAGLAAAFCAGFFLPLDEDGAVHLELPLSYPGEEARLAAQLEYA